MADIRCFLLTDTGRTVRALRRYQGIPAGDPFCPGFHGYHNAKVFLDVVDGPQSEHVGDQVPRDDPRWPVKCDHCDFVFTDGSFWQVWTEDEQRRSDTGETTTLYDAPLGAMWWADWLTGTYASEEHKRRGNGPHLVVRTPGGDWDIDAPSSNGQGLGWTRRGDPPNVVATPSILIEGRRSYHGFLGGPAGDRPGYLVEC